MEEPAAFDDVTHAPLPGGREVGQPGAGVIHLFGDDMDDAVLVLQLAGAQHQARGQDGPAIGFHA